MGDDYILFQDQKFFCGNSFLPNLTSSLIADAALEIGVAGKHVLDLGCGCGALGLSMLRAAPSSVTLSDISKGAIQDSLRNLNDLRVAGVRTAVTLVEADGFQGIERTKKFDLIINDVSGIAEPIARISPWFNKAPCESGEDGLSFFKAIILNAQNYLSHSGALITPLLSLSDVSEAYRFLATTVNTYRVVGKKAWFLPEDMTANFKEEIEAIIEAGFVKLENKFGRYVAWTEVLVIEKSDYK